MIRAVLPDQETLAFPATPSTATAAIRVGELAVGSYRVPYRAAGPSAAGEAVVFLHGNPGSSEDWEALLAEVGVFTRAVALDLPGYGQAERPSAFDYSLPGYAHFLHKALAALRITRVHLVTHDIGGYIGLQWAAPRLHQLASLTMINSGVPLGYHWHGTAKLWRTPVLGELSMLTLTKRGLRFGIQRGATRPLPVPFVDRMYREFDRSTRRTTLELYRSIDDPDAVGRGLAPILTDFKGPVLVVWGERDPFATTAMPERQREVFPQAQIELLPDSGHWSFIDDPERVAGLVVPFLRKAL